MAAISPSFARTGPEQAGLAAFRASLPAGTGNSPTAERLCAISRPADLAMGEPLSPEQFDDRLIYISSGAAKLVARSPAASLVDHVLAFRFGGDLISVLRQSDGDVRLIALSDCKLVIFPAAAFLDIAQGHPAVLRSVLTRALQALHHSRTRMMQMGHKSAEARIADFLVSMAGRLTGCTTGTCVFVLPMGRRDIGDSLGLTVETVICQLDRLRKAGLVETEGRSKVCIADIAALARRAGHENRLAGITSKK